jgi:hypothetical protein
MGQVGYPVQAGIQRIASRRGLDFRLRWNNESLALFAFAKVHSMLLPEHVHIKYKGGHAASLAPLKNLSCPAIRVENRRRLTRDHQ